MQSLLNSVYLFLQAGQCFMVFNNHATLTCLKAATCFQPPQGRGGSVREWMKDAAVAIFYLSAVVVFWLLTGKSGLSILWSILGCSCFLLLEKHREVLSALAEFMYLAIMFMLLDMFIMPLIFEN